MDVKLMSIIAGNRRGEPRRLITSMRQLLLFLVISFSPVIVGESNAHSGGLNASGCHGGSQPYHCHRLPSEIRISNSGGIRLRCDLGSRSEDCDGGSKPNAPSNPDNTPTGKSNYLSNDLDSVTLKEERPTTIDSKYLFEPGFSQSALTLQILLIRHCSFLPVELANGVMTNATLDALHFFQKTHGIDVASKSALERSRRLLQSTPSGNCNLNASQRIDYNSNKEGVKKNIVHSAKTRTREPDTAIRLMQERLNLLGFNAGKADGYMGSNTRAAIRRYQSKAGHEVTGKPSSALIKSIKNKLEETYTATTPSLQTQSIERKKNETTLKRQIERAQFFLGVMDLYHGPKDGIMNEKLEQAVLRFQVANRISADGSVSAALLHSIRSKLLR